MATLSANQEVFLTVCVEGVLYGATAMLFWSTVAVLMNTRNRPTINRSLLLAICVMMMLATVHLALTIAFGLLADITLAGSGSSDLDSLCLIGPGRPLCLAESTATMAQLLLGDGVNLYRLWLVWERSWRPVVIPGFLFLLGIVASCLNIIAYALDANTQLPNGALIAFGVVALVQPMLTSSLIILRLWTTERRATPYRATESSLSPIIRMITESAAVYVAALLFVSILWLADPVAYTVGVAIAVPIVPLTFCGLTTRVGVHSIGLRSAAAREELTVQSPIADAPRRLSSVPQRRSLTGRTMQSGTGASEEEIPLETVSSKGCLTVSREPSLVDDA